MIDILYKDKYIIVCVKPEGVISEAVSGREKNMPDLLKKQTGAYKIDVVHRLDKPVGGLMVFSCNSKATAGLSNAILHRQFTKEYYAVVHGKPEQESGELKDILFRDREKNKSFVVKTLRKGAKEAALEYETVATAGKGAEQFSLINVRLITGRTHQIRVQFASRKMPLLGDDRYGSSEKRCDIALFSRHLAFTHPITHEKLDFSIDPPDKFPWNQFSRCEKNG